MLLVLSLPLPLIELLLLLLIVLLLILLVLVPRLLLLLMSLPELLLLIRSARYILQGFSKSCHVLAVFPKHTKASCRVLYSYALAGHGPATRDRDDDRLLSCFISSNIVSNYLSAPIPLLHYVSFDQTRNLSILHSYSRCLFRDQIYNI
jgi:hypothetical protein